MNFVVLDQISQRRRFDPGRVSVFKLVRANKFVIVAMDESVGIVIEDASGHMVHIVPVIFVLFVCLGRFKRPRLQIQNQDVGAQLLLVARVRGQGNVAAIGFAKKRFGRGDAQRVEEQAEDVVRGRVGF